MYATGVVIHKKIKQLNLLPYRILNIILPVMVFTAIYLFLTKD
jgi:hypothetical protein